MSQQSVGMFSVSSLSEEDKHEDKHEENDEGMMRGMITAIQTTFKSSNGKKMQMTDWDKIGFKLGQDN